MISIMSLQQSKPAARWIVLALSCALIVLVLAIYWQTSSFDFTNYDDNIYVFQNEQVTSGLNWQNVFWAFKSTRASNWHPLTWISHMLDCEFFGLDSGSHHLTNVFLHATNSLLLFFILRVMTGRQGLSWIVAAMFAVHPLHVESVAWISERKDVLSTLFWLLTILAYWRYVKVPNALRFGLVVVVFACGLMAKPMLVSLPIVLLLMDWWPLGRIRAHTIFEPCGKNLKAAPLRNLVLEKTPLFVLSAASCVVTFVVQRMTGAVKPLDAFPIGVRLANAVWAYGQYVVKAFCPVRLACFYPHPGASLPTWQVAVSAIALIVVTAAVIAARNEKKYLFTGWLWYIVTLVPVIGLVQVGKQAMADRYTYVPFIGLFIVIVWGCDEALQALTNSVPKWQLLSRLTAVTLTVVTISLLAMVAWKQTSYWRNDNAIWERALAVTDNNAVAHYNLGTTLATQGDTEAAIRHFREAIRIDPRKHEAYANLGAMLGERGSYSEAVKYFQIAVSLRPKNPVYRANLGIALVRLRRYSEAIPHLRFALSRCPNDEDCRQALAQAMEKLRQ
jgi:hypothetical protein